MPTDHFMYADGRCSYGEGCHPIAGYDTLSNEEKELVGPSEAYGPPLQRRNVNAEALQKFLRTANPRPGGPSYRLLNGEITEEQWWEEIQAERERYGLPRMER